MAKKKSATKKATARKGVRKKTSTVPNSQELHDNFATAMIASAKKRFGETGIAVGAETSNSVVGLPLSHLCLRALCDSTGFPLSRMTQIAGAPGSCKTALLYEMARWHLWYKGYFYYAENENKDAAAMRTGIIQDPDLISRINVHDSYSMEDWQDYWTHTLESGRKYMDEITGPTFPLFLGLDSLTSTDTITAIDAVTKDGHASLDYARLANLIARYNRTLMAQVKKYPFSLVWTNHVKKKMEQTMPGVDSKTVPGGEQPKYMQTFDIHSTRLSRIDLKSHGGVRVKLKCEKNSHGVTGRQIEVEFIWWKQVSEETGELEQKFLWNWDKANIEYLFRFKNASGKKYVWDAVNEVIDLHEGKKKGLVWCKRLGYGSDNQVSYEELSRHMESDPVIMKGLHHALGIMETNVFQPGVDYRQQVEAAAQQVRDATQEAVAENMVDIDE